VQNNMEDLCDMFSFQAGEVSLMDHGFDLR
jgi:hypothetical protein